VKADADVGAAARVCAVAARVSFAAVVVLSPFRGRIEVVNRWRAPVYREFTDFLLSAGDIAIVLTLACWLASRRLRPVRMPIAYGPRFLAWPVVGLLAAAVVGIPFSVDPALSAYTCVRLALLAGLALYVVNEISSIRQLVLPVGAMAAVQAVVAIGQVVDQRSLSLGWLGEHVLRPSLGVSVVTTADGTRVLRGYGLTDHPNILGGMLAFAVLVLVGAAAAARRDRASAVSQLGTPVLVLSGAALFLTFSRGSWIGAVLGLVVIAAMLALGPDRRALRPAAVAAVAVGLGVVPFVAPYHDVLAARTEASSTIATEARSIDEREALTTVTSRIVSDHLLLGVGVGALPLAMRRAEPDFRYDYQPAASVLLDVTAETGVVGGFAYLVLLVAPWIALVRRWRTWTTELAAASGLVAAVTVIGVIDYYTWAYSPGRIWIWLILGIWAGAHGRSPSRPAAVAAPVPVHTSAVA